MVSFNFLSKPISLSKEKISVLYIENYQLYRKTIDAFYNDCNDESEIIFSQDYVPIKYKNNVCFIFDYFNLDFSSQMLKKIYEDLTMYSNTYLYEETAKIKADILGFLELLSQGYDYDFGFKDDTDIVDLLKIQNFKPILSNDNLAEKLLDFIIMVKKYSSVKCFVLLNLHCFFNSKELELFYEELKYQNIEILVIENIMHYKRLESEVIYIIDEDLCEIVDLY